MRPGGAGSTAVPDDVASSGAGAAPSAAVAWSVVEAVVVASGSPSAGCGWLVPSSVTGVLLTSVVVRSSIDLGSPDRGASR
ncbi:hypothetical protein DLJ96_12485 [Actinotalea fermentans ATCC 43279 = JCM 9966 = DSM 3133]|nr:hypothetical protein DLJ96_12485 [Actinotalea fermentans ATCC 43279 = JCM 9966 = DSM 3133]